MHMNLAEASKSISMSLQDKYLELKNELNVVNNLIGVTAKEFKNAAAAGDVRENSAYSEAESKLTQLNTQKLYIMMDIESIESITTQLKYVPKSYIDLYSTFSLKRHDTGQIFTYKVYPGTVSDIQRGIMSSTSEIYKSLQGKEAGNVIKAVNRISGAVVQFTILEVY